MTWRAGLEPSFARDGSTLHLIGSWSPGKVAMLMDDGSFQHHDEGTAPDNAGIFLPRAAVKALVESLAPDATAGEIGRLEEALKIERARVDQILANVPIVVRGS